jgi:hypothetical protein
MAARISPPENWLTIANRVSAIFADSAVAGVLVTMA